MAKNRFTVSTSGLKEVQTILKELGRKAPRALARALYKEAEQIMGRSKADFVPVRDGHLRASGKVLLPKIEGNRVTVEAGFGDNAAPYALKIHEYPLAGKTGKPGAATVGGWKFLEIPYTEAVFDMDERIAAELRKEMPETR